MSRKAEDVRVKEWLFQALESQSVKTYRKYVTLFFILIFSAFSVNNASAKSAPSVPAKDGKTITVRAIVPLTPEFVYGIKKNSSLVSDKAAFALGEEMHITIRIVGGNDESLREHRVRLQVVSLRGEELVSFSGKTNRNGLTHFTVVAGVDFLGDNILQAIDVTYDVPILLQQTISFLVYTPADDEKHRKQATENSISGEQSSVSGQIIPVGTASAHGADVSRNSGTIVMIDSKIALTRAGP